MSKVFENSRKTFEQIQAKQGELGQRPPSALSAREVARRAAAKLRKEAKLSQKKLHRPVTV